MTENSQTELKSSWKNKWKNKIRHDSWATVLWKHCVYYLPEWYIIINTACWLWPSFDYNYFFPGCQDCHSVVNSASAVLISLSTFAWPLRRNVKNSAAPTMHQMKDGQQCNQLIVLRGWRFHQMCTLDKVWNILIYWILQVCVILLQYIELQCVLCNDFHSTCCTARR